jgi:hypothetical protein
MFCSVSTVPLHASVVEHIVFKPIHVQELKECCMNAVTFIKILRWAQVFTPVFGVWNTEACENFSTDGRAVLVG